MPSNRILTHCKRGHEFTEENTYVSPKGNRDCRTCGNARKRKWLAANPEKCRKATREWNAANPETMSANSRKWNAANPERARENKRRWLEDRPGYFREWAAANPEKLRANVRRRHARKLSQLGLWHHMEAQLESLMYQSQEGCYYYCGRLLDWKNRINSPLEHKTPLSRGGVHGFDNWCIACRSCNSRKGTKTIEEFSWR